MTQSERLWKRIKSQQFRGWVQSKWDVRKMSYNHLAALVKYYGWSFNMKIKL